MRSDAEIWEGRYQSGAHPAGTDPSPFLAECVTLLRPGRALDVAAGAGRNAVFLAAKGWHVTAVDISATALQKAAALAAEQGIPAQQLDTSRSTPESAN